MPSVLFIHENFPAQFGGLAQFLAKRGWNVVFATAAKHVKADGKGHKLLPGVHVVGYRAARDVSGGAHPYLTGTESAVLNGQACARLGAGLKKGGFNPDVIVAHSGWGSGSFAKVVWPEAIFVQYLEWWYRPEPEDVLPNDRSKNKEEFAAKAYCRNLPFLMDAQIADAIWVPTQFQASQIPDILRSKVTVLHDGVDGNEFRPKRVQDPEFHLDGLPADAQIITYATRGMEPMRGFPQFMAAWAKLQHEWPKLHCVIAGADRTCYGAKLSAGPSHKQRSLRKHDFDETRLHFCGFLPKAKYRSLLQRSSAHVYLTRPFVLSWSLIEAMMTAVPLVTSDVKPVREAAPDGTAKFADIDDVDGIAAQVSSLLSSPEMAKRQGNFARAHALQNYAAAKLHRQQEDFLSGLIDLTSKTPADLNVQRQRLDGNNQHVLTQ